MLFDDLLASLLDTLPGMRVLVADRHVATRDSLRTMLADLGIHDVITVGTAHEVLHALDGGHFDLILSDFQLSDERNGQQLLEELRHAHRLPLTTAYLIVSGERGHTNIVSMAELAPDDYLVKPFTTEHLQTRLLRALAKKQTLRDIYLAMARGRLQEAIAACDAVIAGTSPFRHEALRHKGELLNALGRHVEAEALYRAILETRSPAWAQLGLATALQHSGRTEEAQQLAERLTGEHPDYMEAYDFLAALHAARGDSAEALRVLQQGAMTSPHNTRRQRLVGDMALRNHDLRTAEKAYAKVLERNRGSSLHEVEDFSNLASVLVERGDFEAARRINRDMQRAWRSHPQAELAALVTEARCLAGEGLPGKAAPLIDKAVSLLPKAASASRPLDRPPSQRLAIDLAHACLASGQADEGTRILRQIATENHDDPHVIGHITSVFQQTGQADSGEALLSEINAEVIALNNAGVMAAKGGDLRGAVSMLIRTAEQVPSVQFLVNAAKAIFTLLDQEGWDATLAEQGRAYLQRAIQKDRLNPKVSAARELHATVAAKYGIDAAL